MKRLEKILLNSVGAIIAVYAAIVLLFSLPSMQRALADWTADVLTRQLGAKVSIGSVNLGFLNRVIIDDLTLHEPSGQQLATVSRVSASVNLFSLLTGRVDIGTAQLFGTNAKLYRKTPDSKPNYQFIIDAFASTDEEPTDLDLRVGSFIMRRANVTYDVLSEPAQAGSFDMNHLRLRDCGMNVVVRCLNNDSLNVSVKRLQAKELNSGLSLSDTQLRLEGNRREVVLTQFKAALPHSDVAIDSLHVDYAHYKTDSIFTFYATPLYGHITPSDFTPLYRRLAALTEDIPFHIEAAGDERSISIKKCLLGTEAAPLLHASAQVTNPLKPASRNFYADISALHLPSHLLTSLTQAFAPEQKLDELLNAIQEVNYIGTVSYDAQRNISSQGSIESGIGRAAYELTYDASQTLSAFVNADSLNLGALQGSPELGTATFNIDLSLQLNGTKPFPAGNVAADISNIHYNGYNYENIRLTAQSTATKVEGILNIDDENVKASSEFAYTDTGIKDFRIGMLIEEFRPNILNLTDLYTGENLTMYASANLHGSDLNHLYGEVTVEDLNLMTTAQNYHVDGFRLRAEQLENGISHYNLQSDILKADILGETTLGNIVQSFNQQLALHLPVFFKPTPSEPARFSYDLTLADAPLLHHFTQTDFAIQQPIHVTGTMDSQAQQMELLLDAPSLSYNEQSYDSVKLKCSTTSDRLHLHTSASSLKASEDDDIPDTRTSLELFAEAHDNRISSDFRVNMSGRNNIQLQLLPTIQLSDSLGSLKTAIALQRSNAVINDTTWTVSPSLISLYKKDIECRGVKFASTGNKSFLAIEGKSSPMLSDSLVTTLHNLEVKYFLSLVNFQAVRFAGLASGHVTMNNVIGNGVPNMRANLYVHDLSIQEGLLGDANIAAHWDKEVDGISIQGRIVDLYSVPDGLTGRTKNMTGITTVDGWVSPAKQDLSIMVNTHNTNAKFIHGFLRGIFKEVSGYVTGPVHIIGPFNNVNILADAVPNMNLRLRATNVPYHIEGDTIHMRPYLFEFPNIHIYDRFGHRSTLDGKVTHRNMKNFAYHFQADLHELLAYEETEFNSDKFMGTVFADGDLTIDGRDGHPLHVNANVTPTRGSFFAYDAATPDAITGNTFIEFRDRDSLSVFNPRYFFTQSSQTEADEDFASKESATEEDSLAIVKAAKKNYASDIYINFDINLTPACEVKLRMDNLAEDGYMHTFGNAKISAKWYNKGTFQMFGNYNIGSGSYRLYLQDIIFRDLSLQPGSMVEFNGHPFDANIHLICHHAINSVPLSDLTATTAFSQNNKVKVICLLDITGKLGNMDFKFGIDIPNISEEARQLVRSMINSEEEMNTQAIYLLGFGRFYPNEYARANGNGNSGQAANSLLSSTLSGQINHVLKSMIGSHPNWSFGSLLSTGERGWEDLDVEGLLEGRLLDDRLLINGAFGYRDNVMTNNSSFIGDFEVKWRMNRRGNLYVKAYNQTNDRYFTKSTLNTQGLGLSWRHDFESIRKRMREQETQKDSLAR